MEYTGYAVDVVGGGQTHLREYPGYVGGGGQTASYMQKGERNYLSTFSCCSKLKNQSVSDSLLCAPIIPFEIHQAISFYNKFVHNVTAAELACRKGFN